MSLEAYYIALPLCSRFFFCFENFYLCEAHDVSLAEVEEPNPKS